MLLPGQWLLCDDGILRPIFRAELAAADGSMAPVEFLADTGADRTVLSAATLARLGLPALPAPHALAGVGGVAASVLVDAVIHMPRTDGGVAVFRGRFAALTDLEALDMSVPLAGTSSICSRSSWIGRGTWSASSARATNTPSRRAHEPAMSTPSNSP